MSIDRRLSKMEQDRERTLDALTKRLVDWIQSLDKPTQFSVWRLIPTTGCREADIEESTIMWSTAGRPEPDATDRQRAAEAWQRFPPPLLAELEAAQRGSINELRAWFCVGDA